MPMTELAQPALAQQLIAAAQSLDADTFIVATDNGILHKMKMAAPGKRFIDAPTAGNSERNPITVPHSTAPGKPRTAKRLYFDVIPKNVDDYEAFLDAFPRQLPQEQVGNPLWHIHDGKPPVDDRLPAGLTFGMLLNLVSASNAHPCACSAATPARTATAQWATGRRTRPPSRVTAVIHEPT